MIRALVLYDFGGEPLDIVNVETPGANFEVTYFIPIVKRNIVVYYDVVGGGYRLNNGEQLTLSQLEDELRAWGVTFVN